MKKIRISELPLSESTKGLYLLATDRENKSVKVSMDSMSEELQAADKANEDLAREGISKAESASAMLFAEEAARKEADLSLNDLIEAEVTERLQSVATEAAARKAADAELRDMADEGLSKADAALSQIHEERQERAAQDRALAEAVSQERAERTAADAVLQAKIAILVPSAMTVEAPKRITWGNVFPVSIKAVLSPVTAMRNLIFISDNKAVEVSTDGVLTPVAKGVSRVHVIPTQNTALARTCVIEVGDPRLRLSSQTALRFTQAGGLRLT